MSKRKSRRMKKRGPQLPRVSAVERARLDAGGMDPRTEKILRTRLGVSARDDHRLEFVTPGNAANRERLRQIQSLAINGVRERKLN